MLTQVTVIVPDALKVLGCWHFSAGDLRAACGEPLGLKPGPARITITVNRREENASFAYTANASLDVVVPARGSLIVFFPSEGASKILADAVNFLAGIVTQF
jgi:hypothetical protein